MQCTIFMSTTAFCLVLIFFSHLSLAINGLVTLPPYSRPNRNGLPAGTARFQFEPKPWGLVLRTEPGLTPRLLAVFFSSLFVFVLGITLQATPAHAATYAGLVMDAKTGKILYSHRGEERHYPASLTKMMTLYLLFEAMEAGKVSKSTRIKVSRHAASMQPSKLGVKAGGSVSAEQAILSLVTKSANDIAAAVAEHLGGTESEFGNMMTKKARALGMDSTTFKNASGLPDSKQVTNARDMAILGMALRDHFPKQYAYFSKRSFTYGKRTMGNHNRLLGVVRGVDGIKTGYTRASGFNLVTSVNTDGRSIVAVVLGGRTGKSRNAQMVKLVKQYLPKASRGKDSFVIARSGGTRFAGLNELPKKGPLPVFRQKADDPTSVRVASAHIISAATTHASVSANFRNGGAFDINAIKRKLMALGSKRLPVPTPAPSSGATDPVVTAQTRPPEPTQSVSHVMAYAAEPSPIRESAHRDGWQIQIAAVDDLNAAIKTLENARRKASGLLDNYDNYTESVDKNGITLYRARFAGFDSKSQARNTCKKLKRKKLRCLAIEN